MAFIFLALLGAALMLVLGGTIYIRLNHHYPAGIQILTGLSGGFLLSLIFFGIIPEAGEEMLREAIPPRRPGPCPWRWRRDP